MRSAKKVTFVLMLLTFISGMAQVKTSSVKAPKTDLHTAVFSNNFKAIRLHIEAGSDLNVPEPTRSSSPLITAAAMNKTKAAKMLLDGGADINYKNADGSTALHTAALFGYSDISQILIDAGINLNIQNNDGTTALHTAAFFGRVEILEQLMANSADKTVKNNYGQTAYETVILPFESVKGIYESIETALKPLGFSIDFDELKTARTKIAEMLKVSAEK